ncbi:MAG: hypothetical protein KDB82_14055, partial [Planctomycetes bacterium]|nr:hypothetical protein [Planctomycetota bacterium]
DAHLWTVGGAGFDDLLETLENALAGRDREWVIERPLQVEGINTPLPRLVRTALRTGPGVSERAKAVGDAEDSASWPLLATRQLLGRTAALCTDTWGDAALAAFWQDSEFQGRVGRALGFLKENSGRVNLVLNRLEEGAELVWTGEGDPPQGDLQTGSGGAARYDSPGRWLLADWPAGNELKVLKDGRLLQNIPLPTPVPHELAYTGDDPVFFQVASEGGVRVFSGLDAWRPRRFGEAPEKPSDTTWLPALLAVLFVLAGFAARRK